MRTKIDKLESLFKWLLTPTTFLMLVAWNYENYLVEVGLDHPSIMNFQVTETNLLDASRLLITEITIFGLSIFAFLLTYIRERGKLSTLLRFLAFWGLLFTLTLIWFTFAQAEYPLLLFPTPSGNVSLSVSAVISFALTFLLIWHARSEPQPSSFSSHPNRH
jgi:hypothetical protein